LIEDPQGTGALAIPSLSVSRKAVANEEVVRTGSRDEEFGHIVTIHHTASIQLRRERGQVIDEKD
jgi:hypothetical protein